VRDIDACWHAGIGIISVCWGFNSRAARERRIADYLVESPNALLSLLLPSRGRTGARDGQKDLA